MINNTEDNNFIKLRESLSEKCHKNSIKNVVARNIKKCNTMRGIVWELKKVFQKACLNKIITSDLIESYPKEFGEFKIYSNCDVSDGYLLISGNNKANVSGDTLVVACDNSEINSYNGVTLYLTDSAKANAYNRTQVTANDDSSVVAFDNVKIRASKNCNIELHGKSVVFAVENVSVDAYEESSVKAFGFVNIKAHDKSTVVAYDSCNVEGFGKETNIIIRK